MGGEVERTKEGQVSESLDFRSPIDKLYDIWQAITCLNLSFLLIYQLNLHPRITVMIKLDGVGDIIL